MRGSRLFCLGLLSAFLGAPSASTVAGDDVGPLVRALWLVHRHGTPEAVRPENDPALKGTLFKQLGKREILHSSAVEGIMDAGVFAKLAGEAGRLDSAAIQRILDDDAPASRIQLFPKIRGHVQALTTSFDWIPQSHRQGAAKLVEWIVANHQAGRPLHVVVICTGNSRRSILAAAMGNVAASYYGMPELRFHSGGTHPTAFNPRTIATLREIGVEIQATGKEAARGAPDAANPIYRVHWGDGANMECKEFSKTYDNPVNPRSGFAAIMVCGEADSECPLVKGASIRIPLPYLDPKIYDDGLYESPKYSERRDDVGRLMLNVMMQARNRLAAANSTGPTLNRSGTKSPTAPSH
jgi:hypothetical protein